MTQDFRFQFSFGAHASPRTSPRRSVAAVIQSLRGISCTVKSCDYCRKKVRSVEKRLRKLESRTARRPSRRRRRAISPRANKRASDASRDDLLRAIQDAKNANAKHKKKWKGKS